MVLTGDNPHVMLFIVFAGPLVSRYGVISMTEGLLESVVFRTRWHEHPVVIDSV